MFILQRQNVKSSSQIVLKRAETDINPIVLNSVLNHIRYTVTVSYNSFYMNQVPGECCLLLDEWSKYLFRYLYCTTNYYKKIQVAKFELLIVPEYACVKYSNIGNVRIHHVIIFLFCSNSLKQKMKWEYIVFTGLVRTVYKYHSVSFNVTKLKDNFVIILDPLPSKLNW